MYDSDPPPFAFLPLPLQACGAGRVDEAKLLLDAYVDVNAADPKSGQTAVMAASVNNHIAAVALLIEAHADLNKGDAKGSTPTMVAAINGHLRVVELLLEAGADSRAADLDGNTAITFACQHGRADTVRVLITAVVNVNSTSRYGVTPLINGGPYSVPLPAYQHQTFIPLSPTLPRPSGLSPALP